MPNTRSRPDSQASSSSSARFAQLKSRLPKTTPVNQSVLVNVRPELAIRFSWQLIDPHIAFSFRFIREQGQWITQFELRLGEFDPTEYAQLENFLRTSLEEISPDQRNQFLDDVIWLLGKAGMSDQQILDSLHGKSYPQGVPPPAPGLALEPPATTSRTLGVSPLLACIRPRVRKRLQQTHQINLDELETESVKLYQDLEQLENTTIEPDFQARVNTFHQELIAHHQRIKQLGLLLGGRLGKILTNQANSALTGLMKQV